FSATSENLMLAPLCTSLAWCPTQNISEAPGRLFVVFTPAGMERFFHAFSQHAGTTSAADTFRLLGRQAGMDVVGQPLSGPTRCSARVLLNPASLIQPMQSEAV